MNDSKKLSGVIIAMPTPLLKNEDIDLVSLGNSDQLCVSW